MKLVSKLAALVACCLTVGVLVAGCSAFKQADPVDVRVAALKGPTAMGMIKFANEVENKEVSSNNYQVEFMGAPDVLLPKIVQGEVDIAAIPAPMASALYNQTKGQVQVMAINTLGVLYAVQDGSHEGNAPVRELKDLEGKKVYISGKGATPEYIMNYLLKANGLEDKVVLEWKSEHKECVAALKQDPQAIAILPQPFVAAAQAQLPGLRILLDFNELWKQVQANKPEQERSDLVTAVAVVRKDFAEKNPAAVQDFLKRYEQSINWVNSNAEAASDLIGKAEIVPAPVARVALPACNIVYISGKDMKSKLEGYLKILAEENPKAVGGKLPEADFYYKA